MGEEGRGERREEKREGQILETQGRGRYKIEEQVFTVGETEPLIVGDGVVVTLVDTLGETVDVTLVVAVTETVGVTDVEPETDTVTEEVGLPLIEPVGDTDGVAVTEVLTVTLGEGVAELDRERVGVAEPD